MNDYVLFEKTQISVPEVLLFTLSEFRERRDIIDSFRSGYVGLDFETNTYDYMAEDFYVRTVGLANDEYVVSIDFLDADEIELQFFKAYLLNLDYVAHNSCFEAGTLRVWAGDMGKPICDTYILFADLACEFNRPHSLAAGMEDLLGQQKEGDKVKEHMKANKWTWTDVKEFDFEILGRYNAIDAWGCWEMYKYFDKVIQSFDSTWGQYYWDYHREDCLNEVFLQVEARFNGIDVDTSELESTYSTTIVSKDRALDEFINDEAIQPHLKRFHEETLSNLEDKRPEEFTKTGKPAARYIKWRDKLEEAKTAFHFNTNSTQQLRWLFFDQMGIEPVEFTPGGDPSTSAACLAKMGKPGELLLKYRKEVTKLKFLTQVVEGQRDGKIRPFIRPFAALSTRCGGGTLE